MGIQIIQRAFQRKAMAAEIRSLKCRSTAWSRRSRRWSHLSLHTPVNEQRVKYIFEALYGR